MVIHGDCRDVLPVLDWSKISLVFLDCPWPEEWDMFGMEEGEPLELLIDIVRAIPGNVPILHITGAGTDETFTQQIHGEPYTHTLQYPDGREAMLANIYNHERVGCHLIAGESECITDFHPCPMSHGYVRLLLERYAGHGYVLDPTVGSGVTLAVCRSLDIPVIAIEKNFDYYKNLI